MEIVMSQLNMNSKNSPKMKLTSFKLEDHHISVEFSFCDTIDKKKITVSVSINKDNNNLTIDELKEKAIIKAKEFLKSVSF
jgi:hypothetical protein